MSPDHTKEASSAAPLSTEQVDNKQAIAARMEALASELRTIGEDHIKFAPSEDSLLGLAAKIYQARRKVDTIFDMIGFAVSPAWDMMLDLYQAKIKGRTISVTSACIGGACPATTGLRWLQVLESRHLVVRKPDAADKTPICCRTNRRRPSSGGEGIVRASVTRLRLMPPGSGSGAVSGRIVESPRRTWLLRRTPSIMFFDVPIQRQDEVSGRVLLTDASDRF